MTADFEIKDGALHIFFKETGETNDVTVEQVFQLNKASESKTHTIKFYIDGKEMTIDSYITL